MQSIAYSDLLARFQRIQRKGLIFLNPTNKIDGLFSEDSQEPQNLTENLYDPNDFYIAPKHQTKKKPSGHAESKPHNILLIGKSEAKKQHQTIEERKKIYRPGVFALFYEINEGTLDKDAEAWYYKEHKDIVGPVSSYNMDKMIFYKKIDDETRVAFKSIDKFVKFGKIKKIVEAEKGDQGHGHGQGHAEQKSG